MKQISQWAIAVVTVVLIFLIVTRDREAHAPVLHGIFDVARTFLPMYPRATPSFFGPNPSTRAIRPGDKFPATLKFPKPANFSVPEIKR